MDKTKQDWVWYELITTDLDAAASFYGKVVGWQTREMGPAGSRYLVFGPGGDMRGVGGMMAVPAGAPEMSPLPGWVGYIFAEDVDNATRGAEQAGARICREPTDIPGVGRFSVVADPQGAVFYLFKPTPPEGVHMPPVLDRHAIGNVGWHELGALDGGAALPFYEGQFGWTRAEALDMGPHGKYEMFSSNDSLATGGVMTVPEAMRPEGLDRARWTFYFNVDHIQRAKERVEANGGKVVREVQEVPGGGWVLAATDPQGLHFSLTSSNG